MGGRTDMTLVRKLRKGDTVIQRNLQCVNHGYILRGNVSEHICFWTLPSKCEAVVPEDVIKNKLVVRAVCRSCAYYCDCALLKDAAASIVPDIRTLGMLTIFSVLVL
ncbi:uncharacterized protein LOC116805076 [Drosophila grimshawi]|uniref:uncharacterized protein LOC116805076 n=1 Tax=Drosophila grimshawi TaxID=7222 RepID=UPI001C935FDD|nr:uncharacterized protein LOC116805076 [Drosophila grimshawi]